MSEHFYNVSTTVAENTRNFARGTPASSQPVAINHVVNHSKQVFLCYCRKDSRYVQRLIIHLASCPHTCDLSVWDDSRLQAGSLWQKEIASALAAAHFAILLLSADFLASSFIRTLELPHLLQAAYAQTTHILPVILQPCLFEESLLSPFQAVNDPSKPLSLLSPSVREKFWVNLVRTIIQMSSPSP